MAKNVSFVTVTIPSTGTSSDVITPGGSKSVLAVITPSAISGTSFKFQAAIDTDGTTYVPVYNGATEYEVGVGTSRYVALNQDVLGGCRRVKIISTTTETAARSIIAMVGEVQ